MGRSMLTDALAARARSRTWMPSSERVEALATLAELFASDALAVDDALQGAATALSTCTGDAIVVYRLSDDRRWLLPCGMHDPEPSTRQLLEEMEGRRFAGDEGFTATALDTGSTIVVPRVTVDELMALQPGLSDICIEMGMTGFIVTPMLCRGTAVGITAQGRTTNPERLKDDDARFLEHAARWLAVGVQAASAESPAA